MGAKAGRLLRGVTYHSVCQYYLVSQIYQNGKFCTFPHAIEFLNRRYEDIFPILTSYPELENYLSPFMDAWLGGAAEQLMGQIASAKSRFRG